MKLVAIYTTWDQVGNCEFSATKHVASVGESETVAGLYARLWPGHNEARWGNYIEIHPVVEDTPDD